MSITSEQAFNIQLTNTSLLRALVSGRERSQIIMRAFLDQARPSYSAPTVMSIVLSRSGDPDYPVIQITPQRNAPEESAGRTSRRRASRSRGIFCRRRPTPRRPPPGPGRSGEQYTLKARGAALGGVPAARAAAPECAPHMETILPRSRSYANAAGVRASGPGRRAQCYSIPLQIYPHNEEEGITAIQPGQG